MTRNQVAFSVICFLLLFSLVMMAPAFAQSQSRCALHSEIIKGLGEKFHEDGVGMGVAGDQALVELYVSKDGATWSILSVGTNGIACFIATGDNWMTKTAGIEGPST